MKIKLVINVCHGVFGISVKAAKHLVALGEPATWEHYTQYKEYSDDWYIGRYYRIKRYNPNLVKVVEELGDEANGDCAQLAVIEIDMDHFINKNLKCYAGKEEFECFHTKTLITDRLS